MTHDTSRGDKELAEEDALIDEDEFLLQRYLDNNLSGPELADFERRMTQDSALSTRVEQAQALFAALDSSALARSALMWSEAIPSDLVERAIERWQDTRTGVDAPSERPDFAGWFQPARVLAFANVLLIVALGGIALQQGPAELVKTWVLATKDLAFFLAALAPSAEQLAYGIPTLLLGCSAGLLALGVFARRIARRGR